MQKMVWVPKVKRPQQLTSTRIQNKPTPRPKISKQDSNTRMTTKRWIPKAVIEAQWNRKSTSTIWVPTLKLRSSMPLQKPKSVAKSNDTTPKATRNTHPFIPVQKWIPKCQHKGS